MIKQMLISTLFLIAGSSMTYAQWSGGDSDDYESRDVDSVSRGDSKPMQRVRISAVSAFHINMSGKITDQSPSDNYSEIYPFSIGVKSEIDVGICPAISVYFQFGWINYLAASPKTETISPPPITFEYWYDDLSAIPIVIGGKFRIPTQLEKPQWFDVKTPSRLLGFTPYFRLGIGALYIMPVDIHVEIFPNESSADFWKSQAVFAYQFGTGADIRVSKNASLIFEIMYFGTTAPNVNDDYIDKSDPFGQVVISLGVAYMIGE